MDYDGIQEALSKRYDKDTVRLLGQKISVRRKTLKIQHFEDLSNGFTSRLHLLKVDYPMEFNKQIFNNPMQKSIICIGLLKY